MQPLSMHYCGQCLFYGLLLSSFVCALIGGTSYAVRHSRRLSRRRRPAASCCITMHQRRGATVAGCDPAKCFPASCSRRQVCRGLRRRRLRRRLRRLQLRLQVGHDCVRLAPQPREQHIRQALVLRGAAGTETHLLEGAAGVFAGRLPWRQFEAVRQQSAPGCHRNSPCASYVQPAGAGTSPCCLLSFSVITQAIA